MTLLNRVILGTRSRAIRLARPTKIAKPKPSPIVREKAVETCNAGSRRSASLPNLDCAALSGQSTIEFVFLSSHAWHFR
jgi:hypothetical protein